MAARPATSLALQLALVALAFGSLLHEWGESAFVVPSRGYMLVVPVLFVWLLIDRGAFRTRSPASRPVERRIAAVLLGLAALALFAGEYAQIFTLAIAAFPVAVTAVLVAHVGGAALRQHAWALLLLLLVIPMPAVVAAGLSGFLTQASASFSGAIVEGIGGSVLPDGVLELSGSRTQVTEACGGSGTLMVLWALTLLQAGLCRARPLTGIVFIILVPVLTLLVNTSRIVATLLLLVYGGREAASGVWHHVPGIILILIAMAATSYLMMRGSRARGRPLRERGGMVVGGQAA